MPALDHPSPADLQAFAVGSLSEDQAQAVESHLAGCPSCLAVAAAAPDDTLVTLLRSAETSQSGPVTPGPAYAETIGLSQAGPPAESVPGPPELARHTRYRLIRPLGRGGMGQVWLAEHTVMGRPVALKLIRPEFLDKADAVERFRREVRAAAKLKHPNIVAAHDADQAGGLHFLVMEYIDGETLAERIAAGPVPVKDACRWIIDAARGLEHARLNGLIHRDVKPHNLILERATGQVKVLDFGLAGVASGEPTGLTGGNVVIGTPDYISPEQAEDARTADTRSDVYSLGCTLYHLLTGRPPFPGDAVLKKLDAHRKHTPEPLTAIRQDMTPALAELVARMLAKDPADRPQTPGEVAVALERLLAGGGRREPPPLPPRRRRRGWGRGARRVGYGLLLAVLAAAGLGWMLYSERSNFGTLKLDADNWEGKVDVRKDGQIVAVLDRMGNDELRLPAGTYDLECREPDRYRVSADQVVVRRRERVIVALTRVPPAAGPPPDVRPRGTGPAAPAEVGWTDLIPPLDPATAAEVGQVARDDTGPRPALVVTAPVDRYARVRLPFAPAESYEVQATITRTDGSDAFVLVLPVPGGPGADRHLALHVDGDPSRGGRTDMLYVNSERLGVPMKTTLGGRLEQGQAYRLYVRVTAVEDQVSLRAELDEFSLLDWSAQAPVLNGGNWWSAKDNSRLALGAVGSTYRVGRLVARPLPASPGPVELVAQVPWANAEGAAFSADGRQFVVVGAGAKGPVAGVFDVDRPHDAKHRPLPPGNGHEAVFLPDGRHLLVRADDVVYRWEMETGRRTDDAVRLPDRAKFGAATFRPSPDGQRLAAALAATILVYRTDTGAEVFRIHPVEPNARLHPYPRFSPDGRRLATVDGTGDGAVVRVFDATTGGLVRTIRATGFPAAGSLSWADDRVVSADAYNPGDGVVSIRSWDVGTGREQARLSLGKVTEFAVGAMGGGGRFYISWHNNETIRIWDLTAGRLLHTQYVRGLRPRGWGIAPDGRSAVVCGFDGIYLLRLPGPPAETPGSPAPLTLHGRTNAAWTDLMPLVDASLDREAGTVTKYYEGPKAVIVVGTGVGRLSRVAVPARPGGDYELRTRITRLTGTDSFNLMLPVPGVAGPTQIGVRIDTVRGRDVVTGLDWPGGFSLPLDKTLNSKLRPGQGYDVVARVTTFDGPGQVRVLAPISTIQKRVRVGVEVNGTTVLEWDGPVAAVREATTAFTNDRRCVGFGATASEFRVEGFEFRMLNGSAPIGRPAAAAKRPEGPRELVGGPDAPWTDLIPGVNIPTHRLDGTWGFQGGTQTTSLVAGDPKGKGGKLALPIWPKGDYELRLRFARTAGDDGLVVMLPVPGTPGTQTALILDGRTTQGGFVGIEYVDRQPFGVNTKADRGERLANGTVYSLLVRVRAKEREASVRADIDGGFKGGDGLFLWGPDAVERLTPHSNWFTPDRGQLGLGVREDCQFRIDSVEFRPLSGTATWKPGPAPKTAPREGADAPGQVRRFGRYKGPVHHMVLSPDGQHAFVADDGVAKWDVRTGEMVWVASQPAGSILAVSGDGTGLTVWGPDRVARVLDPVTGKERRQFAIPPEPIDHAVLNRDGTRAVVSHRATDEVKPAVRVWDVAAGKALFQLHGHAEDVYGVAVSGDGTRIATASFDGTVRLWDSTGQPLHVFRGHDGPVCSVALSADGKYLATGGGEDQAVRVWDVEEKRCASVLSGHTVWVTDVAFTPDGTRVVSVSGNEGKGDGVRVWDWRAGEQMYHFSEVRASMATVAVTPDGRRAVTAENEGAIRVWRLPDPPAPKPEVVGPVRRFGRFAGSAQAVALSPDGRFVYSLDTAVVKWDRASGKMLWAHELKADGSYHLAVPAAGRHVLAGCLDGTVRVLDAATGAEVRRFSRHGGPVLNVAGSPDGLRAVSTSETKEGSKASIRVWEIDTGKELFELTGHTDATWSVAFSKDGTRIATASDDGTVRLWAAADGKELAVLKGHKGAASAVAFSPDGKRLASGGQDLTVRVWGVDAKEQVHVLEGHDVWVTDVAFTPDGTRVLSVSSNWDLGASDGLRVWNAGTGKPLYDGVRDGIQALGLAVDPDGRYAVTGGMDGAIRVWKLPDPPAADRK